MAKKYYAVWKGRETGVFTTWAKCKSLVDGYPGAKFKSFPTLEEAESALGENSQSPTPETKPKLAKNSNSQKSSPLTQEQIDAMPYDIKIYTDGACDPNPGEAGTGLAVYKHNQLSELWYGLYQAHGTNNTAELHGLNQALLFAKDNLALGNTVGIFCDSKYSIDCITQWASGWEKKGWTKSGGEIKNLDIIKPTYSLYQQIASQIVIHHVNGHVGVEGNELADRMSIIAIESQNESFSLYNETNNISELLALRSG